MDNDKVPTRKYLNTMNNYKYSNVNQNQNVYDSKYIS